MITHEDLKIKIEKSGWPAEAISSMAAVLPQIGQQTLNYLYTNFDVLRGSPDGAMAQIVKQIPAWREQIETGQQSKLPEALASALQQGNQNSIELLSKLIYDLHVNNVIARRLTPDLNRSLTFYQFAALESISFKEVVIALTNFSVDLALVMDLESELKRFAYYKNYEQDAPELRKFREAIEHCEQILTDNPLRINEQTVPGTVKNFIADYKNFTANLPPGSSSYGVANYVTAAPAIKLLDKNMALALRRILEAYAWCLVGIYSEQEIHVYEKEREGLLEALPRIVAGIKYVEPVEEEIKPVVKLATPPVPAVPDRSGPPPLEPQLVDQRYIRELNPQLRETTPLPKEIKIDSITPTGSQKPKPVPVAPKPVAQPQPAPEPKKQSKQGQSMGIHDQPSEITTPANPYQKMVNPEPVRSKSGVVRDDTNIQLKEELQRIQQEQAKKSSLIQKKLLELRSRNQTDDKTKQLDKQ